MGCVWCCHRYESDEEEEEPPPPRSPATDPNLMRLQSNLVSLLKDLPPEDILIFALDDSEIYEVCKYDVELRQMCILGAVRRYHFEKFTSAEVYNRTANYMVMLDNFVRLQDEYETQCFLAEQQQQQQQQARGQGSINQEMALQVYQEVEPVDPKEIIFEPVYVPPPPPREPVNNVFRPVYIDVDLPAADHNVA